MNFMFVTLLVSQLPMSWLKAGLNYRTGRHGLPRGVSVDGGGGTCGDGESTRQQAGRDSTYVEHGLHVSHGARVPVTDGLVEGRSNLQYRNGRIVV